MAVDILKRQLEGQRVRVVGVNFGAKSKDEMYKNLSRLMSSKVFNGEIIEEPMFKMPSDELAKELKLVKQKEKFIRQMCDLQKEVRGEMWKCNHPDLPNYHDDFCDSMALACLAFVPRKESGRGYRPMIG